MEHSSIHMSFLGFTVIQVFLLSWSVREKILVSALAATILIASAAVLMSYWQIHSVGRIKAIGVEVFWDPECTVPCDVFDWGEMRPGDLGGFTVYIKNTRNTNFTLTINTTDWVPVEVQEYFTLDWNYSGEIVCPEDVLPVQITLYLSVDVPWTFDSFSHNIWIIATEVL